MSPEFAKQFAQEWVGAWNTHDITEIMAHYADELDFNSPVIRQIGFNDSGKITRKTDLEQYFSKALGLYPDLHFELHEVCVGTRSVVLYYTSINGKKSAEVMVFDAVGKVCGVWAHYGI